VLRTASAPPSRLDLMPVHRRPTFEGVKRFVKGAVKVGELVEGSCPDASGIEVAHDQSIAFGSSERFGEHFVRNAVERVVKVSVTPVMVVELGEDLKGPPPCQAMDQGLKPLTPTVIQHGIGRET
jgi:hypothetical protein